MDSSTTRDVPAWLVFGLTGQVGVALQAALAADDPPVIAVSRGAAVDAGHVRWIRGALPSLPAPGQAIAAIASLGPLDVFAEWFEHAGLAPARVIALGSTSVHAKAGSADAAEAALAVSLAMAERRLEAAAARRGSQLLLLRPTLIYGNGRDQSLSRLVRWARRWRWLPLPAGASGLRQPVHVDDLAATVLRCLRAPVPLAGCYDLPGAEALPFRDMVVRLLAAAAPGARVLTLPRPLVTAGIRILRANGRLAGVGPGVLDRLGQDQAYDAGPARIALGHAPRGFQPGDGMFPD